MTADNQWHPGIGDPTLAGWLTVVAYLGTAFICWKCAIASRQEKTGHFLFWIFYAVLLFGLGINKQLDLQTWFTEVGKQLAKAQGWYERRRVYQVIFITIIALLGLAAFAGFYWMCRRALRRHLLALLGGIFLVCFVLARAASFHSVDQLLGNRLGGLKVNWILELGGILCICLGALQNLRVQSRGASTKFWRPARATHIS